MRIPSVLILLGAAAFAAAAEENAAVEWRQHFVVHAKGQGDLLYEVTQISRSARGQDHEVIPVSDVDHGKLLLERISSYSEQSATYRISDDRRKDFIAVSFRLPFTSKTRAATLEEAARQPELLALPAMLNVETAGGRWNSVSTDWDEWTRLRELRRSVRATISPFLLEAIERMRGSLFSTPAASAYAMIITRYVVYGWSDPDAVEGDVRDAPPSCDFDKRFGYACSEAQLRRIESAAERGEVPPSY